MDVKELAGYTERRERADTIVNLMWEVMSYWFLYMISCSSLDHVITFLRYHSKYNHKWSAGTSTHYMYNCAQNSEWQHASLKSSNVGIKHHDDKESMDTFNCSGWIHIMLSDHSDVAFIKLTHCEEHVPYCPIDIPEDIEKYVQDNLKFTPMQVS